MGDLVEVGFLLELLIWSGGANYFLDGLNKPKAHGILNLDRISAKALKLLIPIQTSLQYRLS